MGVQYPIPVAEDAPFPLQNIPFGIFSTDSDPTPRVGTIIGDQIIDVNLLARQGAFDNLSIQDLSTLRAALLAQTLNHFASLPRSVRSSTRQRLIDLLEEPSSILFKDKEINSSAFTNEKEAKLHLPLQIGAFADFLCSETHHDNGNRMSGKSIPAFYHFPPMYTGRTTSIVPSGQSIKRPKGMVMRPPGSKDGPKFQFKTSTKMDYEVEIGVFISKPIPFGQRISADEAKEHIFGLVLLNDWSARDIQFGEMIPMGPSNGKATATTISPWVVMPDALGDAQVGFVSEKAKADISSHPPHLRHAVGDMEVSWDIVLEATVSGPNEPPTLVCRSNLKDLYWSPGQMLAHWVSAGSGANTGDLLGTGTASSPGHTDEIPTLGCLFELTEGGQKPFKLRSGRELRWLEDGDEVVLTGWAKGKDGKRIGFGQAAGCLLPSD
ncbi:fumarylacetoacetase [Cladophialophora bantiana CBS 173.52]|uniref:Fumarylacetoacetase n=1 Tax=Cladophialophora bantiana (strain ATCC 10958 / CBS 173.52 / CDC B-1940 / NIH 8579) TaxID=1442370 RepID=A0A0D2GB40_CLAB1|nr:fumarylacetoacetase [Cladophialophora bantiana CBS 173.52]KIW95802.1 fumarylacetoacetase [Cladophialophora bantiana CBS 173.52]